MKLPNGFGTIRKLKGRRRKPYMVEKTIGYELVNGKSKRKYQILGYFSTKSEALTFLTDYNKNPYEVYDYTFKDIYEMWSSEKYKTISSGLVKLYTRAFNHFSPIHDRVFKDLRTKELEDAILNSNASPTTKPNMKNILNQMYKYALKYEYVQIDYSSRFAIEQPKPKIDRQVYTKDEITRLWANKDDKIVCVALIQLYSGMRVGEVLTCEVDLEEMVFKGGLKTDAGRDRIVPIHSAIKDIVTNIPKLSLGDYERYYKATLKELGMKHTTHDARVTFISKADGILSDTIIKKIVGHKFKDITKDVYTKKSIEELREAIEKISY